MRYFFRCVFGTLLFLVCILGQFEAVGEKKDFKSHLEHFQYTGLMHPLSFSPNGRYQVLISENRYHGGSEFFLMLAITEHEGRARFGGFCLTPRYLEIVAAPHGNISYLYWQSSNDYTVDLVLMDEVKMSPYIATSNVPIEQLHFSKDGQHFCYFVPLEPHPLQSPQKKREVKLSRMLNPAGWRIQETNGKVLRSKKGKFLFSDEEKKTFTEWAPAEEPKVIPQIFTQPMPKITLETQVRWAPDTNKYIYLWDETGIWRVAPYPTRCPMWTKIVNAPRISNLQISSSGKHLLYEVRPDLLKRSDEENLDDPFGLHNEIWLVDIETVSEPIRPTREDAIAAKGDVWPLDLTKELAPRIIAKGWGATFNPSAKAINYANEEGHFLLDLETLKPVKLFYTGIDIRYKKSILD